MLKKIQRSFGLLRIAMRSAWLAHRQEELIVDKEAGFEEKLRFDAFPRTHFAYGVYFAALQAKALGYGAISVYEFGVGWGGGLLELERIAALVEQETSITIDVYGFDTGSGMPNPIDYRDLPHVWKPGFFHLDVASLQKKLTKARLIIGNVCETVNGFIEKENPAPIGFISIDVDYYSSTIDVLRLLDAPEENLLPRVYCYFDDIIGDDWEIHCEYVGEMLAISEFNKQHAKRKICKINALKAKRLVPAAWNDQMYVMHTFDHSGYTTYINPKPHWETKRFGVA